MSGSPTESAAATIACINAVPTPCVLGSGCTPSGPRPSTGIEFAIVARLHTTCPTMSSSTIATIDRAGSTPATPQLRHERDLRRLLAVGVGPGERRRVHSCDRRLVTGSLSAQDHDACLPRESADVRAGNADLGDSRSSHDAFTHHPHLATSHHPRRGFVKDPNGTGAHGRDSPRTPPADRCPVRAGRALPSTPPLRPPIPRACGRPSPASARAQRRARTDRTRP